MKIDNKDCVVEYEPDSELRDFEQVPLSNRVASKRSSGAKYCLYAGRMDRRNATKLGYEISFTRHFYKPQPLRTPEEIRADIIALERETEGLLDELLTGI